MAANQGVLRAGSIVRWKAGCYATRSGERVAFDVPALRGTFSGTLSADGKTLTGAYGQANLEAPVVFKRR